MEGERYTFNHHAMKSLNDGLQMRSDWELPTCVGKRRLKLNGSKAHSTQKTGAAPLPAADGQHRSRRHCFWTPSLETGTTGGSCPPPGASLDWNRAGCKLCGTRSKADCRHPEARTTTVHLRNPQPTPAAPDTFWGAAGKQSAPAGSENSIFGEKGKATAQIMADGSLEYEGERGSIHQIARLIEPGPRNGWLSWFLPGQ